MSVSLDQLDDTELLKMVVASAQVIAACVYELRRRQFNIKTNENYFMACGLVRKFYPHIAHETLLCYVGNLSDWLDMAEEDLPPVFCITRRCRTSLRKLNELKLKCDRAESIVHPKKVHGGNTSSSSDCGGDKAVTQAAAVKPKRVTLLLTFFF